MEYLAREEKFVLDGDRRELERIKQELDDLRSIPAAQVESKWEHPTGSVQQNKVQNEQLVRLKRERDDLLAKGYPDDDPIILQLGRIILSAESEAMG